MKRLIKLYIDHNPFWQKQQPFRIIKDNLQPVFYLTVVGVIGSCSLSHVEQSPTKPGQTEPHDTLLTSPSCHFHWLVSTQIRLCASADSVKSSAVSTDKQTCERCYRTFWLKKPTTPSPLVIPERSWRAMRIEQFELNPYDSLNVTLHKM